MNPTFSNFSLNSASTSYDLVWEIVPSSEREHPTSKLRHKRVSICILEPIAVDKYPFGFSRRRRK